VKLAPAWIAAALTLLLAQQAALAQDRGIEVLDLDTILKSHPLSADDSGVTLAASRASGKGELQIVVARKIPLHIHDQDHVVFIERGTGTARIENAAGAIETRPVKPGDIVDVPAGKKHAFEKTGEADLVMLVVTTPSSVTKFFE
jgi:mannose-6-phosphate isomerase-like protein (cupin superfamily)